MLRRLEIDGYGLIARARIEFASGATMFTGETGSGKTMLLGALGFVLGARAGSDVVRRGASKAIVTIAFDPTDELRARLVDDGFELDPGEESTIVREMNEAGRSSVRVNGRPATASYVREIGDHVAEIVGQYEAQRLLSAAYHLDLLDRYAGASALTARTRVAGAHARAAALTQRLAEMQGDERRARELYDDASFGLREIEEVRPEPGEDRRLDERRRFLDNVERITAALRRANESLAADDAGAAGALGNAGVSLAAIAHIDARFAEMAAQAAALQSEANELAATVAGALDDSEFDPLELEGINERLESLDRLKRKYGGTIEAVLERAAHLRTVVDGFEGRDRQVAELTAQAAESKRDLAAAAAALTKLRKASAATLSKAVIAEFADLALSSGRFQVALVPREAIAPDGAERVEFLFAANAGEEARPISRVASGGELSRVLLALVVALAATRDGESALVFDEIDTGIGGTTATAVGARLGRLARAGQVVCVTHLAQLATWADRHYVLEKSERGDETTIGVREIAAPAQRESELARMLSGESDDIALEHARSLLQRRV